MLNESRDEEIKSLKELAEQPDLDSARAFLAERPNLICETTQRLMRIFAGYQPHRAQREHLEAISALVRLSITKGLATAYEEVLNATPKHLHPFEVNRLACDFLAAESELDAWRMLREYPEIDLAVVRPLVAFISKNKDDQGRIQQWLSMLENKSELEVLELTQGLVQAEQLFKHSPSIENLRLCSDIADEFVRHDLFRRFSPAEQATALNRSANYHLRIWVNTYERGALDNAIEQFAQAEGLNPGVSTSAYATALVSRYESQGDIEDLNVAIIAAESLLQNGELIDTDEIAAQVASSMANALRHRFTRTGSTADIERAVMLYERLVQISGIHPALMQVRLLNFSAGLGSLYEAKGDLAALTRSIDIAEQCFNEMPDEHPGKSTLANNIGLSLQKRYVATLSKSDIRAALDMHLHSVKLTRAGAPEEPRNLTNCGMCHVTAHTEFDDRSFLDDGIRFLRNAINLFSQGQSEAGRLLLHLSKALMTRFKITDAGDDINEAVLLAIRCRDGANAYMGLHREALAQLARSLAVRSDSVFAEPNDGTDATRTFQESMKIFTETFGTGGMETAVAWGAWAWDHERWNEAAEAFLSGLAIHRRLVDRQNSRETREVRIRRIQGLGAMAASALIRCGRLHDAVVALEEGRGILLAQGLNRQSQDFNFSEIVTRAGTSPLVYLENIAGGFALIVRDSDVQALDLPMLREEHVNSWLAQHLNLRLTDPGAFETKLSDLCRWLWDACMGQVVQALGSCQYITLIPGGYLGMMPLHAAWTEDASKPTGRKYAMDCLGIRYAPTALSLGEPHRSQWQSILCIDDPQPTDEAHLPFSEAETRAASHAFERAKTLPGKAASKQATLKLLPEFDVIHFSCHGKANLDEPLTSGLLLSNSQLLTLSDLFELDLQRVDLVVLSACDTAQMGTYLPDEVISLPSGMLQVGVTSVISPLWPIDSFSTLTLLARFYELLRETSAPPCEAMRLAQIWLRDTRNKDIAKHFRAVPEIWRQLRLRDPLARGFASISDFAAFIYSGA